MQKKLLIADDHPLIREVLTNTFTSVDPPHDVNTAADADAVLSSLESNPDTALLLLDLYMPGSDGFSLLATLRERFPRVKVVVLTASEDPADRSNAEQLGVAAYVLKSEPSHELIRKVRQVLRDEAALPEDERGIATDAGETHHQGTTAQEEGPPLTNRQQEILELLSNGFSNKEIARHLDLSMNTVKIHVSGIFRALSVNNRTKAAMAARNSRV